jgi:formylglycine-generating enzyme required for sulfatase activity
MAVFETTQKQFENVMGYNPVTTASAKADTKPVSSVVYQLLRGTNVTAQASAASTSFFGVLASKLSAELSAAGLGDYEMELPTISQWEYACRAGTTGSYNNGTTIAADTETDPNADLLAWYGGTVYNYAEGVGRKLPNAFGLYDMHGNVEECCLDRNISGDDYKATFAADWEKGGVTIDPDGGGMGATTTLIVKAGGSSAEGVRQMRSGSRWTGGWTYKGYFIGFRLWHPARFK